jgi:hypothetical protein
MSQAVAATPAPTARCQYCTPEGEVAADPPP